MQEKILKIEIPRLWDLPQHFTCTCGRQRRWYNNTCSSSALKCNRAKSKNIEILLTKVTHKKLVLSGDHQGIKVLMWREGKLRLAVPLFVAPPSKVGVTEDHAHNKPANNSPETLTPITNKPTNNSPETCPQRRPSRHRSTDEARMETPPHSPALRRPTLLGWRYGRPRPHWGGDWNGMHMSRCQDHSWSSYWTCIEEE